MSVTLCSSDLSAKTNPESKTSKTSRIKFKSSSFSRLRFFSSESSKPLGYVRSQTKESSQSLYKNSSEDLSELLDPTNCYHPQCSFAYHISEDIRKSSLIVECLPQITYQRLAILWGLDIHKEARKSGNKCTIENKEEEEKELEEFVQAIERDIGIRSDISEDLIVNAESYKKSIEAIQYKKTTKDNPYRKFLKKIELLDSKQKTISNLGKKAGKITKLIIKNFLEWYQSLGGNDEETFIEESTLQELFHIGFDMPAAKSVAVRIKELPTVPEHLALLRNEPKHATRFGLRQLLANDLKMENIPMKMFAFGSMLPKEKPPLRYKPPKNYVKQTWMECSRVPADLDTMKTVWVGLEKLRSTIAFSNWLKNHPEVTPPSYLQQKGLLEINFEKWNQMFKGFEVDVENLEVVMSDGKILQEKPSFQESKFSEAGSMKFNSYDSFL